MRPWNLHSQIWAPPPRDANPISRVIGATTLRDTGPSNISSIGCVFGIRSRAMVGQISDSTVGSTWPLERLIDRGRLNGGSLDWSIEQRQAPIDRDPVVGQTGTLTDRGSGQFGEAPPS